MNNFSSGYLYIALDLNQPRLRFKGQRSDDLFVYFGLEAFSTHSFH